MTNLVKLARVLNQSIYWQEVVAMNARNPAQQARCEARADKLAKQLEELEALAQDVDANAPYYAPGLSAERMKRQCGMH